MSAPIIAAVFLGRSVICSHISIRVVTFIFKLQFTFFFFHWYKPIRVLGGTLKQLKSTLTKLQWQDFFHSINILLCCGESWKSLWLKQTESTWLLFVCLLKIFNLIFCNYDAFNYSWRMKRKAEGLREN